ncbi:MAG: IS30 family transposase [Lachnospiraceae bacterium]|nr:IS30 family transposase [Lachnospiraceae bacterium]
MGNYITERQRYEIELLLREKYSKPRIAETLGIKYNTLYKEIARGTVEQMDSLLAVHKVYKADYAQMVYDQSTSNRGRNLKIGSDHRLAAYIETMIREKKYSPEALIRHAEHEGLHFKTTLCPKTIYNYLDMGLFLNASNADLPYKKAQKKKKKEEKSTVSLNNRRGRSIEERPKSILDREEYGHWEMDTVVSAQGTGLSCLLVLSERMTREEIMMKIRNKKSCTVVRALNRLEKKYGSKAFREKFKTVTCDNGVEFLDHNGIEKSIFTKQPRTTVYYCHPYSSYERGTNENINRMIRRFFPKGTNFDEVTPDQVAMVESWINNYPRKIFGGLSSSLYRKQLEAATA